ncbi:MAG: ROK family protein [Alphaproteobacteria bacterium]|jgi:fructokinase|nr:ROK family protein [Alphaproteobacteria bacterium]
MRIGIDLGGTKIEAIAIDSDGVELARSRIIAPQGSYAATLDAIAELVARVDAAPERATPVGIGIPGTVSPATGLVKNANSTWLIGHPIDRDLSKQLARPVRVANDANCFAISEATDGAGMNASVVFGVILGTGVGGGIAIDRGVIAGANAIAGEWGHTPLPWMSAEEHPGKACYCGRSGCIETFISGPAFEASFTQATGKALAAREIVEAAKTGDSAAEAALQRYEDQLGRALTVLINIVDPDTIVLGGGLSNIERLYKNLPERIAEYAFSDAIVTPVVPAMHGDSGGVRGAAWLWPDTP